MAKEATVPAPPDGAAGATLLADYAAVRRHTEALAAPLSVEDQNIQSMPDASPTKWHLAHTTWFFEAVVLGKFTPDHVPFDSAYHYLFNSYYEGLGPRHPRPLRGMLSRPAVSDIVEYRMDVDEAMARLIEEAAEVAPLVTLRLHHEQQRGPQSSPTSSTRCHQLILPAMPPKPTAARGMGGAGVARTSWRHRAGRA